MSAAGWEKRKSLRGRKAQESNRPRPDVESWGGVKEVRLFLWDEIAEAPIRGLIRISWKSAGADGFLDNGKPITGKRKALKGEA
jgi:hypothetical protein